MEKCKLIQDRYCHRSSDNDIFITEKSRSEDLRGGAFGIRPEGD